MIGRFLREMAAATGTARRRSAAGGPAVSAAVGRGSARRVRREPGRSAPAAHCPPLAACCSPLAAWCRGAEAGDLADDVEVPQLLEIIDRAYIMHDGQVLMEGLPHEIVAHEGVRRVYLGEKFSL